MNQNIDLANLSIEQAARALRDRELSPLELTDAYLDRNREADAFLPWQIIDGGLKESFFRTELEKSLRAEQTIQPRRVQGPGSRVQSPESEIPSPFG